MLITNQQLLDKLTRRLKSQMLRPPETHTVHISKPTDAATPHCRLINDEQSTRPYVFMWLTVAETDTAAAFLSPLTPH